MGEKLQDIQEQAPYELEIPNPNLIDFTTVEATAFDESKPWKPATEVNVNHANGSQETGVDATTPAFVFKGPNGDLSVSIVAAGHIDGLHIHGQEPGSQFDYDNLTDLFADVAAKLPEGIMDDPDKVADFSIDMGKPMGKEGIASLSELMDKGILGEADIEQANSVRADVAELNASGEEAAMDDFVKSYNDQNPDAKVKFQKVRNGAIVPVVKAPKQDTTELFLVFGPDGKGGKTLFTAAPGRHMPKHPIASQHQDQDGSLNQESFKQSADAWFDTAMLVD